MIRNDLVETDLETEMKSADTTADTRRQPRGLSKVAKSLIFFLEIGLILFLLIWWLSSDSVQESKNLWVLFFYCFPSEFLVAIVPHEPVLLYFGKFYSPQVVALVSVAGTVMTEILNYSAFKYVSDTKFFQRVSHRKTVIRIIEYFKKAPFIALCIAGFTPVPFYPFRFMVVMAKYPLWRYILAVFLSRTPRFFIIALVGHTIKFPDYFLAVLFVALIVLANIPLLRKVFKRRASTHAS